MAQIEAGQKLGEYVFDTAFEKDVKLSEKVKQADKTVLLFLRYYGCRICQLDMRFYADAYDRFKEKNAQLLVVLQSPVSTMQAQTKPGDVPYDIICDPEMKLFKKFGLLVADSKETMIAPEDQEAYAEKRRLFDEYGLVHGAYEGEELQLPGYFLLDSDLNVLEAHRATSILDMPSVDEMIAKL